MGCLNDFKTHTWKFASIPNDAMQLDCPWLAPQNQPPFSFTHVDHVCVLHTQDEELVVSALAHANARGTLKEFESLFASNFLFFDFTYAFSLYVRQRG